MLRQTRGQSTIEYAVMAAVVVAALLLMQRYMQRGVAGKLRTATDQIGEQFNPYSYGATSGTYSNGTRTEIAYAEGGTSSTLKTDEVQERHGSEGRGSLGTESISETLTKDDKLFQ